MKSQRTRYAFTLVEIMVVVLIISLLALLLVTGMGMIQNKAMTAQCSSHMKSIAAAVKAYASDWQGYSEPTGDAYPLLFSLPIRGETAYNQTTAYKNLDFVCPLDKSPLFLQSGYKSSYQVSSQFAGGNISDMSNANKTVLISELGKRHKNKGGMGAIYVFADLHLVITSPKKIEPEGETHVPGLWTRWFYRNSTSIPATEPRRELIWSQNLARDSVEGFFFLPGEYYQLSTDSWTRIAEWDGKDDSNTTQPATTDEPRKALGLFEGYLDFPLAGTGSDAWRIDYECTPEDSVIIRVWTSTAPSGTSFGGLGSKAPAQRQKNYNINNAGKHRFEVRFLIKDNASPSESRFFNIYWEKLGAPAVNRQIIPVERLTHVAHDITNVQN